MVDRDKLLAFAKYFACPFVLNLDAVRPYTHEVSILLVGSLATGMNTEQSNVDICILCKKKTAQLIDGEMNWSGNHSTELTINGVRTRYYIAELETVLRDLTKYDDLAFYLYGNAIPLDDVSGAYKKLQQYIAEERLEAKRKRYIFSSLLMKRREVSAYFEVSADRAGHMIRSAELLKALLRAISAFDGNPFDPGKYPYQSAVRGKMGKVLQPGIDAVLSYMGRLADAKDETAHKEFIRLVDNCISAIT